MVRERVAVQVPQFTLPEAELDPTETMRRLLDPRPAAHRVRDALAGSALTDDPLPGYASPTVRAL